MNDFFIIWFALIFDRFQHHDANKASGGAAPSVYFFYSREGINSEARVTILV